MGSWKIMSTQPEHDSLKQLRNEMIMNAQQERLVRDTKLLQSVNAIHRVSFRIKFPAQVEHCMRLTAERLQAVLTNKPSEMHDPATWIATADEIAHLVEALYNLTKINREYPVEHTDESNQE